MASLNFDAASVAPQQSFTPLSAGVYVAMATESEIKFTKSGGQMAVFTLQVLEGQFAGRKVWARINISNSSPEAERIGQSQLSAFCRAAGVMQLADTVQLHGKPVRIRVKIRTQDGYDPTNEVTGYEPVGGPSAPAAVAPSPAPQAPAPGGVVPPWQKARAA